MLYIYSILFLGGDFAPAGCDGAPAYASGNAGLRVRSRLNIHININIHIHINIHIIVHININIFIPHFGK